MIEPDWETIFAAALLIVGPPPRRLNTRGYVTAEYQRWLQLAWHYCWQQVPEKQQLHNYNSIFERQRQATDVRTAFDLWIVEKQQHV